MARLDRAARRGRRLPAASDLPQRLLASPVGSLVTRPWFDRLVLQFGLGTYLPLSRAWAASSISDGMVDRFLAELPLDRVPHGLSRGLARSLARAAELSATHDAVLRDWNAAFFGEAATSTARLVTLEGARRHASDSFMKGRLLFLPLRLRTSLPSVRFEIPEPRLVEDRHGRRLRDVANAFRPANALQHVSVTRRIATPLSHEFWLRFPSGDPAVGETAWAHVFEPEGVSDPPTLVHGHGLALELESLDRVSDGSEDIVKAGVRLVRLEAPWHNRRRLPGRYGGEPFLASPPLSALDLFSATTREMAMLVAWSRQTSRGRVAVGGTSLGALASQLVITHCHHWPRAYRPDVAFLATTTEDVGSLSFDSSIAHLVKLPEVMAAAGWTREQFDRWRPLSDPVGETSLAKDDIIMVLGRTDNVTPFERGMALARRWRIPDTNLFLRSAGHFSAAIDLIRDPAPMRRLVERLHAA
ncbi:MAG: hypothetical protein ACREEE_13350 [Dongiaceae bacterium]